MDKIKREQGLWYKITTMCTNIQTVEVLEEKERSRDCMEKKYSSKSPKCVQQKHPESTMNSTYKELKAQPPLWKAEILYGLTTLYLDTRPKELRQGHRFLCAYLHWWQHCSCTCPICPMMDEQIHVANTYSGASFTLISKEVNSIICYKIDKF